MVTLVYKNSPFFDKELARSEFIKNRDDLDDINGFETILSSADFWNVYQNGYVGSLFIYEAEDNRLWVGGFARRKRHKECVEALKIVCSEHPKIYADTRHLNAVICLKEAGFRWLNRKKKTLIWRKKDEQQKQS